MRALLFIVLVSLLSIVITGCASTAEPQHLSANQDTCWVCVHENDLACVKVDIDDKTPTAQYNGKTYHFCSEECKKEFVANPAKFAPKSVSAAPQTQPAHH
ncbi:MAG TPA: YHS domain-containing protein [Tepidisphaeraceae bacterium]|jgi:YHS domain-containing protein|nr:YHS domain-containing protein [Tepidisphaeraceae bacterium]